MKMRDKHLHVGRRILFCLLLGVPGSTVMVSLELITCLLSFDERGTAPMMIIFTLQDSLETACNVIGDGALPLILMGYTEKHGIKEAKLDDVL